ncbi:MAG: translation initiation factor IF-3 [Candidatus Jorgensenbacteria bacterium]
MTAPQLRVLDEEGANLGILECAEALRIAAERGLDLIEIAPAAKPPVARIMSFDKFRYLHEKEEKKQRRAGRGKELKHVRITYRAAANDLRIRALQADKFLHEGHKVEIMISFRGREKGNKEWGLKRLDEFLKMILVPHQMTMPPRWGGRGFITQISKK